jgi:hypothetical protein
MVFDAVCWLLSSFIDLVCMVRLISLVLVGVMFTWMSASCSGLSRMSIFSIFSFGVRGLLVRDFEFILGVLTPLFG